MLAFAAQGALLIVLVISYVAYLSFTAFVLSVAIVGIALRSFIPRPSSTPSKARSGAMGKPFVRPVE